mgnify:FL=1
MTLSRSDALKHLTAPGQPYELKAMNIRDIPCRVFVNAPKSLRELIGENVSDNTFIVYQDERYTFEDIYRLACRLATAMMQDYGILKGDRVALSMRNYPEWIIGFTAATSIGAVAVAMNAWWESDEIETGLNDCGAKLILADQERLDRLQLVIHQLVVAVISIRADSSNTLSTPYTQVISKYPDQQHMPQIQVHPEDVATLFYTSG